MIDHTPAYRLQYTFVALLLTAIVLCRPAPVVALEQVSGRYLKSSGGTITLQLKIGNPAPQSLILEQYIPAGTKVLQTSPKARQINSGGGVVKWLLKGVSPGKRTVSMQVAPAISGSDARATLRYRKPSGGSMVVQQISP